LASAHGRRRRSGRDRRAHALCLAFDEDIIGGDPAVAAALAGLTATTLH
jgi:hypothetical protein